jgi:hypothetical protein
VGTYLDKAGTADGRKGKVVRCLKLHVGSVDKSTW